MLLLTFFNRILGPEVFLTKPESLVDDLDTKYINQIKSLLDSSKENTFFTHYFSSELNTANYTFSIESDWARGRSELAMITAIMSEEEPDYAAYQKTLSNFVNKIKNIPKIYKAFYINRGKAEQRQEIKEKYEILKEELEKIYKILSIKRIETEGHLISLERLKNQKRIELSNNLISQLGELSKNTDENCFLVFRSRGNVMKLDILPVEADQVIRLAIIFSQKKTVNMLQEISKVFTKHEEDLTMVFTSGMCQEVDKCMYEVYIDTPSEILKRIIDDLYQIDGILQVESKKIKLKK
ncbi:MAG: hypothetical protein ACOC44_08965 [Promethearchaeia archaeon]